MPIFDINLNETIQDLNNNLSFLEQKMLKLEIT